MKSTVSISKVSPALSWVALSLLVAVSCSTQQQEDSAKAEDVEITYSELVSGSKERYVATIAIEGMGCEMSCGHKISTALAALTGVSDAQIDFKSAGEVNHAIVEYDAQKVNEKELINTVNGLANGHYQVKTVQVVHHLPADADDDLSEERSSGKSVFQYQLPNIFSVFARLL